MTASLTEEGDVQLANAQWALFRQKSISCSAAIEPCHAIGRRPWNIKYAQCAHLLNSKLRILKKLNIQSLRYSQYTHLLNHSLKPRTIMLWPQHVIEIWHFLNNIFNLNHTNIFLQYIITTSYINWMVHWELVQNLMQLQCQRKWHQ